MSGTWRPSCAELGSFQKVPHDLEVVPPLDPGSSSWTGPAGPCLSSGSEYATLGSSAALTPHYSDALRERCIGKINTQGHSACSKHWRPHVPQKGDLCPPVRKQGVCINALLVSLQEMPSSLLIWPSRAVSELLIFLQGTHLRLSASSDKLHYQSSRPVCAVCAAPQSLECFPTKLILPHCLLFLKKLINPFKVTIL